MNFKEKTERGDNEEYEVEIIYKSQNVRRRLELSLRVLQNKDEDGEFYVHQTIIKVKNRTKIKIIARIFPSSGFETLSRQEVQVSTVRAARLGTHRLSEHD